MLWRTILIFPDASAASTTEASRTGIFRSDFSGANGLELVARTGNPTDLGPTVTYQQFRDAPTIENGGMVAFTAITSTGPVNEAIFLCIPGAGCPASPAESIVLKSAIVPGENDELGKFSAPQVADNGDVVFTAKPRNGTGRGSSIYVRRFSGGAVERIATAGGFGPLGTTFKRIGAHHTSPGGVVVFRAIVSDAATWRIGLFIFE